MIQQYLHRLNTSGIVATTKYAALFSGSDVWGSVVSNTVAADSGTIQNLLIKQDTAVGYNIVYTVMLNSGATTMVVTIPAGATSSSDYTHTVDFVAGDLICLRAVQGSVAYNPPISLSVEVETSSTHRSLYFNPYSGFTAGNRMTGILGNGGLASLDAGNSNFLSLVSVPGNLVAIYVTVDAPGAAKSWDFVVYKNGTAQNGSGGTTDTRFSVSGTATSGSGTFSLACVGADVLELYMGNTGAVPNSGNFACGAAYDAATAGEWNVCGGSNATISTSATNYVWDRGESATEADVETLVGESGVVVLTDFYIKVSAAPGVSRTYTYTLRLNTANTASIVAITGASLTGSDLSDSVSLAVGDVVDIKVVPTNINASLRHYWAFTATGQTTPTPPGPTYTTVVQLIRRQRRSPHVLSTGARVFIHALQLDLEPGIGLTTGQGDDALIMLRLSYDGGHTYGEEQVISAGRAGDYVHRAMWRRLGSARDLVVEITVSDPCAYRLLNLWVDAEAGNY